MSQNDNNKKSLTEEGRLVVQMSQALFANDVDETFRIVGRHMDKHRLKVSTKVIREFEYAGRIDDT